MISIIIPFYNSVRTLKRAVESVLNQDFQSWELLLVNDGSTDQSEEVARAFLIDSRISYSYQENNGVSAARNFGVEKANGDWLLFLDSDDSLRSGILSDISLEINKREDYDFYSFGINRIEGNNSTIQMPETGSYYSRIPGTFLISSKIFKAAGGYDERMRFSENTELFHRIGLLGSKEKRIEKVSLDYFDNPKGGSKNLQNMIDSLLIILDKHQNTLSNQVKYLYHQIIGVNYMRFQNFPSARKHLLKAISYKPYKIGTLARLGISLVPPLARKLYPKEVKL